MIQMVREYFKKSSVVRNDNDVGFTLSTEVKNAFEIVPREQLPFTFFAKSYEEKCQWMSDLVMLNIRW